MKLPLEIRRSASDLFARTTGFSGPEIFEWFGQYSGEIGEYPWSNAGSRWMLFEHCLESFPLDEQIDLLLKLIDYRGPMKHGKPRVEDLDSLRKLVLDFSITARGSKSILAKVSWQTVREAWEKALERANKDPEGAITASRSVLEAVCKHILEQKKVEDESKGDLTKLYKLVSKQLMLSPDGYSEEIFKQILGGCASIASGLSSLRNAHGDAHGKGAKHFKPTIRHARLAINSAMTLAEFLIETFEQQEKASVA